MKLILLVFILFITGCGGLVINPHRCHGKIELGKEDDKYNREVVKEYFIAFDDQEIFLKDVFDCSKVSKLKINIKQKYIFNYVVKINFKEE